MSSARERIVAAAGECIDEHGLSGFSLDVVAKQALVSRATIYRQFPGGRDELVVETVDALLRSFWNGVERSFTRDDTVEDKLVAILMAARRQFLESDVLFRLLESEPSAVFEEMVEGVELARRIVFESMLEIFEDERLTNDISHVEVADVLSRLVLSYVVEPHGWDFTNVADMHRLVRVYFLAGVMPV